MSELANIPSIKVPTTGILFVNDLRVPPKACLPKTPPRASLSLEIGFIFSNNLPILLSPALLIIPFKPPSIPPPAAALAPPPATDLDPFTTSPAAFVVPSATFDPNPNVDATLLAALPILVKNPNIFFNTPKPAFILAKILIPEIIPIYLPILSNIPPKLPTNSTPSIILSKNFANISITGINLSLSFSIEFANLVWAD